MAMSRPDGSFVRGFLSSVSLLLFVSYRSQQKGEVFCVQMFLLLVPPCYGAQQNGEVLIDMVRDCSFRLHTLLFPVPYASWTFRPVPSYHTIANAHGSPLIVATLKTMIEECNGIQGVSR